MYQLLISDESKLDILDAFSWYESRREGLGKDFELCLEAGLNKIQRGPCCRKSGIKTCIYILSTDFLTAFII